MTVAPGRQVAAQQALVRRTGIYVLCRLGLCPRAHRAIHAWGGALLAIRANARAKTVRAE